MERECREKPITLSSPLLRFFFCLSLFPSDLLFPSRPRLSHSLVQRPGLIQGFDQARERQRQQFKEVFLKSHMSAEHETKHQKKKKK